MSLTWADTEPRSASGNSSAGTVVLRGGRAAAAALGWRRTRARCRVVVWEKGVLLLLLTRLGLGRRGPVISTAGILAVVRSVETEELELRAVMVVVLVL